MWSFSKSSVEEGNENAYFARCVEIGKETADAQETFRRPHLRGKLAEGGVLHDSIISNGTFPSYFLKDETRVIQWHARLDLAVFTRIAQALNVTARFVGEEPTSQVTGLYNKIMVQELPKTGIACRIIPRKEVGGKAISTSTVRLALQNGDWETLQALVPPTTYQYFTSPEAAPVLERIREAGNVVHY